MIRVFIAGLMIGRRRNISGKTRARERPVPSWNPDAQRHSIDLYCHRLFPSRGAGWPGQMGGPHGLSEILYAYSEAANKQRQRLRGLSANTPFLQRHAWHFVYHRPGFIVPLAPLSPLRASGRQENPCRLRRDLPTPPPPPPPGLEPSLSHCLGVIVIVAALTFFPAMPLGAIRGAWLDVSRTGPSDPTIHHSITRFLLWSKKIEFKYSDCSTAVFDAFKTCTPREENQNPSCSRVDWLHRPRRLFLFLPHQFNLFNLQICFWFWFTCLFAKFSPRLWAEGRGKAHADELANATKTTARKLGQRQGVSIASNRFEGSTTVLSAPPAKSSGRR